jgi:hypothetical protein
MTNVPTVPELLAASGMNMAQLSRRFEIPYRTVQCWCAEGKEHRECPAYVRRMMQTILESDGCIDGSKASP